MFLPHACLAKRCAFGGQLPEFFYFFSGSVSCEAIPEM
jgi:hypothetical protein